MNEEEERSWKLFFPVLPKCPDRIGMLEEGDFLYQNYVKDFIMFRFSRYLVVNNLLVVNKNPKRRQKLWKQNIYLYIFTYTSY